MTSELLMDPEVNRTLGIAGAIIALGLCAVGSAIGTGLAGSAAVGAWKKCYAQGKQAPFLLLSFVGAALTQTLYGMILMQSIISRMTREQVNAAGEKILDAAGNALLADPTCGSGLAMCVLGIFAGLGIGASAYLQGRTAAAAADAQAETGKGFTNYLAALGIIETVAIFVMVFTLLAINKI